jgi:hypothetical protein
MLMSSSSFLAQYASFIAIRNAVERLHDAGYREIDIKISRDEQGRFAVHVSPVASSLPSSSSRRPTREGGEEE